MKNYQLIDNQEAKQYQYHIDSYIPNIEYQKKGNDIALLHTNMPKDLRNQGIGTQLVHDTLEDISQKNMKVVPLCGFVASYINKNPQYKHLVKEGIYIG